MSISQYRRTIERLNADIANLTRQISVATKDISNLRQDISRIRSSITKSTSPSTLRSKESQIQTKEKNVADKLGKIADLEKRKSAKLADLHRTLDSVEKSEASERKKQETASKKRWEQELSYAKAVTAEVQQQSRIQSQIKQSPLVVNFWELPTKIKVLFFASNPIDQQSLRLDEEVRAIQEKIRMSEYRDSLELISRWAVRPGDLLQALNEHRPTIIHFSGHGDEDHIAFIGGSEGETKLVTKDAIVQMINATVDNVKVIIFNTCLSSAQALAVIECVDVAIGMKEEIGDDAARVFAAQFYSAIGFGKSIQQAFDQGIAALYLEGIPEDHIPGLYHRDDIDPSAVVLVRP